MYFNVTTVNRLQKISDKTPSTDARSLPVIAIVSLRAYNGLVPMSP